VYVAHHALALVSLEITIIVGAHTACWSVCSLCSFRNVFDNLCISGLTMQHACTWPLEDIYQVLLKIDKEGGQVTLRPRKLVSRVSAL
jgi:hypothetical protein